LPGRNEWHCPGTFREFLSVSYVVSLRRF